MIFFLWLYDSQKLNKSSDGEITVTDLEQLDDLKLFPTVDGGYGVLFSTSLKVQSKLPNNVTSFKNFTESQSLIYFSKILPNQITPTNSTIIYDNTIPQTRLGITSCQTSINGRLGNECSIKGENSILNEVFWTAVYFYSTGSIKKHQNLPEFQIKYDASISY